MITKRDIFRKSGRSTREQDVLINQILDLVKKKPDKEKICYKYGLSYTHGELDNLYQILCHLSSGKFNVRGMMHFLTFNTRHLWSTAYIP